jgi:hypothetical protein
VLVLLLAAALAGNPTDTSDVYHGAAGNVDVPLPRLDAAGVVIDGALSEEIWREASILTGFSQYQPID